MQEIPTILVDGHMWRRILKNWPGPNARIYESIARMTRELVFVP